MSVMVSFILLVIGTSLTSVREGNTMTRPAKLVNEALSSVSTVSSSRPHIMTVLPEAVSGTSRHRSIRTTASSLNMSCFSSGSSNITKDALQEPLSIDDVDVSRCLRHQGQLVVWLTSLRLDSWNWHVTTAENASLSCTLNLTVPEDSKLHVALWKRASLSSCSEQNYVTVRGDDGYSFNTTDCGRNFSLYNSLKNTLEIVVVVSEPRSLFGLTIIVQALEAPFETKFITANLGYVQSQRGRYQTPYMDSWMTISLPLHHVTLISIRYFRLLRRAFYDYRSATVRLFKGRKTAESMVWKARGRRVPSPEVYNAKVMSVRFTGKIGFLSFRLLYSFHQQMYRPFRVGEDFWNCSVSKWPEFQRHFRCNLERECDGWEDETECFYSGHCGHGRLTVNDRCYVYIRAKRSSWRDSNLECLRRGGYLVSLNTLGEWEAVTAVLKMRRSNKVLLIGLHQTPSVLPFMYRGTRMWTDKTVAYFTFRPYVRFPQTNKCAYLYYDYWVYQKYNCDQKLRSVNFLCELHLSSEMLGVNPDTGFAQTRSSIRLSVPRNTSLPVPSLKCPDGHVTHAFLACDEQSACWARRRGYVRSEARGVPSRKSCPAPMTSLPAMFACSSGARRVPYSLVCDHRPQCADASDETFCVFPPCSGSTPLRCPSSAQCMSISALCNARGDCPHDADEAQCIVPLAHSLHTPAIVHFQPRYRPPEGIPPYFMTEMVSASCPETHFQCPHNGYCLPVFVRCNGVNDCPGREDEAGCDARSCHGFYRCRSSGVCLHPGHVCDGLNQCPQHDDEFLCGLTCPAGCTCHGLDFTCPQPFAAELYSSVRYLDASGSGLALWQLTENQFLVHLSMSRCGMETVHNVTFPNLRSLDLSYNNLYAIRMHDLRGMGNLQYMSLSNNPLRSLFPADAVQHLIPTLRTLDLSGVRMQILNARSLSHFPRLRTLNLSQCAIERVMGDGFQTMSELRVLNMDGCPMIQFPRELFSGLDELRSVQADNFKLCCAATLPPAFNLANCKAPFDEVSSCESLLRADVYVVFLAVFSCLGLLGNLGCFVNRSFCSKGGSATGFGVFVTHLAMSDFLMGVYLATVGVADRLYKGSYLWDDLLWRHSVACKVAGFLSLLSNEVSALIICLITLDRFLVLRFPFSSLRFKARSAHLTCAAVWVVVAATAAVPLTPMTSHWSFYSQTGICIPLPVTRRNFAGRHYAFGVLIVCNFVLFVLIAAGQAAIYVSVRANQLPTADSTKKSTDLRIARRLISVAVSDFLCWFPIGLLGLLAHRGVPIPGELNVGIAILVLPLNSALNPFLYTINVMLERRRRLHEEKMLKQLMAWVGQDG